MALHRRIRISFTVTSCLLVLSVAKFPPLLAISLFKLLASLALAYLLAFVVVQRVNIYKLVGACLRTLSIPLCPLLVAWQWIRQSQTALEVPNKPSLSSLFQRPPPIFPF